MHGLFGWGEKRPLFGIFPSYFPLERLRKTWQGGPVIAVDVGVGSSDHDRACEAFAQLFGVRTDYGEAHAFRCHHLRFGPDYSGKGLLARWGPAHPVHLIGHSFGGNTALTLFRLLAEDYWGIGTSNEWAASITTICSPMHGASLPFAMGLVEPCPPGGSPIRPWSFIYFIISRVHSSFTCSCSVHGSMAYTVSACASGERKFPSATGYSGVMLIGSQEITCSVRLHRNAAANAFVLALNTSPRFI